MLLRFIYNEYGEEIFIKICIKKKSIFLFNSIKGKRGR